MFRFWFSILRLAAIGAIAFGAYRGFEWLQRERQITGHENRAAQKREEGRWLEAAAIYRQILESSEGLSPERRQRVESRLAICYYEYAVRDYSLGANELLEFVGKAYRLNPEAVEDPALLRLLGKKSGEMEE